MNVALAMNLTALPRPSTAPSQAQVNAQVQQGAGSDGSRDRLVRCGDRARSMLLIGAKVAARSVLDKAGITKVAAAKKR